MRPLDTPHLLPGGDEAVGTGVWRAKSHPCSPGQMARWIGQQAEETEARGPAGSRLARDEALALAPVCRPSWEGLLLPGTGLFCHLYTEHLDARQRADLY